jgi:hypothetical protein
MKLPRSFYNKARIRQHVLHLVQQYEQRMGHSVTYPLDPAPMFSMLFDLDVIYDHEGQLNHMKSDIIGCIYPDGCPSPWGRDKLIVINITKKTTDGGISGKTYQAEVFDPTRYDERFTVAHEGMGHYVMQFLQGIREPNTSLPPFCRSSTLSPLEWNANFAAGELLMPLKKILWLLDQKPPGEIIDLDLYAKHFTEYFGIHRRMMEARLKALGYRMFNAQQPWADYTKSYQANAWV